MTVEKAVFCFAGTMVLLSLVLTLYVHSGFIWLTVFVGANLIQYSLTNFCPVAMLFSKLGLKTEVQCALRQNELTGSKKETNHA